MRVLTVGSGFVGRAVGTALAASGTDVVLASRTPLVPPPHPWLPLDATDAEACARTVERAEPDALVLVHGPSDVTWCESHPKEARDGHVGATRALVRAAAGRRIVMISTDNVFDGRAEQYDEYAATAPANAYGAAKLAAEHTLLEESDQATVLRVSLVYGLDPLRTGNWLNYFELCVRQLRLGETVQAPADQWVTPVLVDDVAAVTRAVVTAPAPELLHLGGPERLSRARWAGLVAERLGVPAERVSPVPKASSRYASRPENTCLSSALLASAPATRGIRVRGAREGVRVLLPETGSGRANGIPC
ncbi:SDR family oxidoreductase [Streptomyces griseus]|uniref:SDR family oxidoreductase n=1 Tax=Streptomyces griseus TaxID=1911 RepID=UPI0037A285C6